MKNRKKSGPKQYPEIERFHKATEGLSEREKFYFLLRRAVNVSEWKTKDATTENQ